MLQVKKVIAVIVTYYPDQLTLQRQLEALLPQVSRAVIVDNGASSEHLSWLCELCQQQEKLTLIPLEQNLGIAKAQNEGIIWAKAQGADFVLHMDQDSKPAPDMMSLLFSAYENLVALGEQISALGPKFVDIDSGKFSKYIRFGKKGN